MNLTATVEAVTDEEVVEILEANPKHSGGMNIPEKKLVDEGLRAFRWFEDGFTITLRKDDGELVGVYLFSPSRRSPVLTDNSPETVKLIFMLLKPVDGSMSWFHDLVAQAVTGDEPMRPELESLSYTRWWARVVDDGMNNALLPFTNKNGIVYSPWGWE